jgi:hypothetical protein
MKQFNKAAIILVEGWKRRQNLHVNLCKTRNRDDLDKKVEKNVKKGLHFVSLSYIIVIVVERATN